MRESWGGAVSSGSDPERDGFAILPEFVGQRVVAELRDAVSNVEGGEGVRKRDGVYAVRNLLDVSPEVRRLAHAEQLLATVTKCLGGTPFPVRAILFDKTGTANWLVPWHQDLTICVETRRDVAGYGPWTVKAGVWHVQPPMHVLENMLSVRLHLDDCGESNGALRVLPGTHRLGRLSAKEVEERAQSGGPVCCAVRAGDVMLMKPLILHASSAAVKPAHRRVIHIDYSCGELDGGLRWLRQQCAVNS